MPLVRRNTARDRTTRSPRLLGAALLCVGLVLAGCASTNTQRTAARGGPGGSDGEITAVETLPGEAGPDATTDSSVAPGAEGPAGTKAAAAKPGTPGAPGSPTGTPTTATTRPNDPPTTDRNTTITIGVQRSAQENDQFLSDTGFKGVGGSGTGDPVKVMLDYVKANGGFGGRGYRTVDFHYNLTNQDQNAEVQAMCTRFTEDHKVQFAFVDIPLQDQIVSCLTKRGVTVVSSGAINALDEVGFREFGDRYYVSSDLSLDKQGLTAVDALKEQGYFDNGARVGLVFADLPRYHRVVNNVMIPRLATHGHQFAATEPLNADVGQAGAATKSAVLKFAGRIDNVMLLDRNGTLTAFFIVNASSQGYFPRYGFTSYSAPDVMAQNFPERALRNSIGVGWIPSFDVAQPNEGAPNAGRTLCKKILTEAGVTWSNRTVEDGAYRYCDMVRLLFEILNVAPTIEPAKVRAAAESLGDRFSAAVTHSTLFKPGRLHYGAASTRNLYYDSGCQCYNYRGGFRAIS